MTQDSQLPEMSIYDTHAHLDQCAPSAETVIANAKAAHICGIIHPGISLDTIDLALQLSQTHPGYVFAAAGLHPSEVHDLSLLSELEKRVSHHRFIAIGETGLDYCKDYYAPKHHQIEAFDFHLYLANKYCLPVIIHNRHADADILERLRPYSHIPKIFHCFASDSDFVKQTISPNTWFSFSGMITYAKKGKVIQALRQIPLSNLLIETDSPYLIPDGHTGKENQPAFAWDVLEKVAAIKDCAKAELAAIMNQNTQTAFQLPGVLHD